MQKLNEANKNTDLSKYRLGGYSEIEEMEARIGIERTIKVKLFVWKNMESMRPGQVFNFQRWVKKEDLEMFVKYACLFMWDHIEWEFSNDFGTVRRIW